MGRSSKEKRREQGKSYYLRNKATITAKRRTPEARARRSVWQKKRRKEAPHVFRASWLRNQYGITQEQWDAIFESQKRRCAICLSPDPGGKKGWHTDHCHNADRVRGILYRSCNNGLGKFKEDPTILGRAMQYLYLR